MCTEIVKWSGHKTIFPRPILHSGFEKIQFKTKVKRLHIDIQLLWGQSFPTFPEINILTMIQNSPKLKTSSSLIFLCFMFPPHHPSYIMLLRISVLGQKPKLTFFFFLNLLSEITSFSIFVVNLLLLNNQTKHTHRALLKVYVARWCI